MATPGWPALPPGAARVRAPRVRTSPPAPKSRADTGRCSRGWRCATPAALALVGAGCTGSIVLPAAPPGGPAVDSFEPRRGFAGDRVVVSGRQFGSDRTRVRVRFGTGVETLPESVAADGSRLDVHVPEDAERIRLRRIRPAPAPNPSAVRSARRAWRRAA